MGRKLDALLGRKKTSTLKPTVDLALSRLAVLKKQRQARRSIAQNDVVQFLNINNHERALLRVEQVIKEQNMLDVFAIIEGYCNLLLERVHLIEQQRECPDELKEAISSLLYAATRCGEFPELQEIRAVFSSRFGKDFAASATELRNNCGVNPQMIHKLSTRAPSLESKRMVLKEIASENGIVLLIEDASPVNTEILHADPRQNESKSGPQVNSVGTGSTKFPEEINNCEGFSDLLKARKYRDVADAAQAAFESAASAAAAARAAVELSRSGSFDPDDQNSPKSRPRKVSDIDDPKKSKPRLREEEESRRAEEPKSGLEFEKSHPIQNYNTGSDEEEMLHVENKAEGFKQIKNPTGHKRSVSASSSDSGDNILKSTSFPLDIGIQTALGKDIVFDESDDDTEIGKRGTYTSRTQGSDFDMKHRSLTTEVLQSKTANAEDVVEGSGRKIYYSSHKQLPGNSISHSAEGSKTPGGHLVNAPVTVRTKRVYGR